MTSLAQARVRVKDDRADGPDAGAEPAPTPIVRACGLHKQFERADGTVAGAVDDVSFEVARGEFLVLLGPSGCGKTTLLRMIAGLETPDAGTIEIDGQPVFDDARRITVPPERRRLSMIFQSYALWPHMTVAQNVAYPLTNQPDRLSKAKIAERVKTILDFVHVGELARQYPGQMSGGQQQRVALARALVAGDDLVLFDEPLSNVDAKVREQLRTELVTMQRELGFSAIYVTHDQQEAMGLAHRIAVMGGGKFAQLGEPRAVYHEATSRYVANFVGTSNELAGTVAGVDANGQASVDTPLGQVHGTLGSSDLAVGDDAIVLFRPERAALGPAGGAAGAAGPDAPSLPGSPSGEGSAASVLAGTVENVLFLGPHTEYTVRCGENRLRVWSNAPYSPVAGTDVRIGIAASDVRILRP